MVNKDDYKFARKIGKNVLAYIVTKCSDKNVVDV